MSWASFLQVWSLFDEVTKNKTHTHTILEQQLLVSWHQKVKKNNDRFPSPAEAEIHSNSDVNDKSLV